MNRYRLVSTLTATALTAYLCLCLFGESLRIRYAVPLFVLLSVLSWFGTAKMTSRTRLKIIFSTGSALTTFLVIDVAYSSFLAHLTQRQNRGIGLVTAQDATQALPKREIGGVVIFKPNAYFAASIVGNLYSQAPPEVLSPRQVTYDIDENGFRESTPVSDADIITVGDSFTFGDGVDTPGIWPVRIESLTGMQAYNIGFPGSGPTDSIYRLKYALSLRATRLPVIVWMFFEGNDFDDHHFELPDRGPAAEPDMLHSLMDLVEAVRRNSVLSRSLSGRIYLAPKGPLVFSVPNHGQRCFHSADREAARQDELSVPISVELAFSAMEQLAGQSQVIVVIAPSAVQIYGRHVPELEVSRSRPFAEWVMEQSQERGFHVVDLHPAFVEHSDKDLLYYPDDTHWNSDGHELAAQKIASKIREVTRINAGADRE